VTGHRRLSCSVPTDDRHKLPLPNLTGDLIEDPVPASQHRLVSKFPGDYANINWIVFA
jgi:hypothetical protein